VGKSIFVHCLWCDHEHIHGYNPSDGFKPSHRVAHCTPGRPFDLHGYYIAPFRQKDVAHHRNAWALQQEKLFQRIARVPRTIIECHQMSVPRA
jgi:hypothetical protein